MTCIKNIASSFSVVYCYLSKYYTISLEIILCFPLHFLLLHVLKVFLLSYLHHITETTKYHPSSNDAVTSRLYTYKVKRESQKVSLPKNCMPWWVARENILQLQIHLS